MRVLFAYLDPSMGSLFIQAVIGSALAIMVVLRSYIRNTFYKIKVAVSGKTADGESEA